MILVKTAYVWMFYISVNNLVYSFCVMLSLFFPVGVVLNRKIIMIAILLIPETKAD